GQYSVKSDALAHRHLKISPECLFCGEASESALHLLFQCRFAREIWELSPVEIDSGQFNTHLNLLDIIQILFSIPDAKQSKEHLFPFVGWRIWKARNDLLYNN
ncbi:unnamed protein product, partial [Arabidopsis halleri]